MKPSLVCAVSLAASFLLACADPVREEARGIAAPYLGQVPPGLTPESFAPGLVSSPGWEYGGTFTPDLTEFYFLRFVAGQDAAEFVVFRHDNGQWLESVVSPRVGQPFISPDGQTMHLGRRYMERRGAGWSEIRELGGAFADFRIMRLTASARGTWYFDEAGTDGDGVIRYSRLVDGVREAPRVAGATINSGTWLAHPFIAPDESYLLFDGRREGGFGSSDIYVSFRGPDGAWGEVINLGEEINTPAWEAAASVTPDGKYLFFNRNMGADDYSDVDILWVDAGVIEALRPRE
ncbi:PD40 domain-containing protein [Wenzhouxiangella marina]|uniref:Uncharacterized protein n=1 Tax=Wenzhouxiangella marina TaxID=1579979 RepID=A0A0K0XY89_9GAMM|nr:PD40 domain-containing protein [Wenzhouxiangella marina]AKS42659.1 hypothetical protein WM2015_2296 [Wenzhouxiangella marina]MBB6088653.1 hypothetical protein [Wenzhouxiangella marina]